MSTTCVISIAVTIVLVVVCVIIFAVYSSESLTEESSTDIVSETDAPEVIPDFNPDPAECLTDLPNVNESMKTDFIEACNDISPPAYGIYERGSCYVFVYSDVKLSFVQTAATCNHLPRAMSTCSRVNGGMVMWLPPTLLPRLSSNTKYKHVRSTDTWLLTGAVSPRSTRPPETSGARIEDTVFTQSSTVFPSLVSCSHQVNRFSSWPAKLVSRKLQTNLAGYGTADWEEILERVCARVSVFYDFQMTMRSCHNTDSFICQYEDIHLVKEHVGQSFEECTDRLVECRPCHSMAYNSSTSTCQTYIGDDRMTDWDKALVNDEDWELFVYE